ncbi:hypothetical protein M405DRAFT_96013 [Rhizopogon salebrosus TDB-379]|nr:hypothetical protein M405DRAFT_96013 [Rhizopogon salebrosus TDB-379]
MKERYGYPKVSAILSCVSSFLKRRVAITIRVVANMSTKETMHLLELPGHATAYRNDDIIPLPLSRRTWSKKTFVFFWFATAINIAEWSGASASRKLHINSLLESKSLSKSFTSMFSRPGPYGPASYHCKPDKHDNYHRCPCN